MGISISGRLYDEYIPKDSVNDKVARELLAAYTVLSWRNIGNGTDGVRRPISMIAWVDYFLEDS